MAQNREIGELGQYLTVNTTSNTITFAGNLTVTGNVTVSSNNISVGGNNISPVQSFRNKIINGNFDIWQRTTSSSIASYIDDRWVSSASGSTFTTSRQSFTLGQTNVPNEPTYFHRTAVTSSAGSGNYVAIEQRIESVKTLAGQTATLSFWAKADASKNIAVEFSQVFGTGGSPSSAVTGIGVTTCALTASWQKFTINVTISSISGKTLGSNNDDYLRLAFWFDAGSNFNSRNNSLGQQSGTFDIAQVQLEEGSVATPFEMRPIGMEMLLCQRYYEKGIGICYVGVAGVGQVSSTAKFAVEKRKIPSISITSINGQSHTATSITTSEFTLNVVTPNAYVSASWTADAEF